MTTPSNPTPRFCGQCGATLPPTNPRFCIECGAAVRAASGPLPAEEPAPAPAATGPTVRLANARTEQLVIGGTMRLPSSGAVPPGLWVLPEPPGPDDVVAVYAPLRAVVGGWSATTSDGWKKLGQEWADDGSSRDLVQFAVERSWFPATGAGRDLRLNARIVASSFAEEGKTRRGFRYRSGSDAPMDVAASWWIDGRGKVVRDLQVPQIQLMAPPRTPRISDYNEQIGEMDVREAEIWARQGEVHGVFRADTTNQQRTPVGRGIPLWALIGGTLFMPLMDNNQPLYRVKLLRPLVCRPGDWPALTERMRREAAGLGLDMQTDAIVEWWLDQQGHDGAVFERGAYPNSRGLVAVAFRRSQIVRMQRA